MLEYTFVVALVTATQAATVISIRHIVQHEIGTIRRIVDSEIDAARSGAELKARLRNHLG